METLTKSSLKEAVCEIVFMPSSFDLTLPGILFAELKQDFPIKRERPPIQIPLKPINGPHNLEILQSPVTQFFSSDEHRIVQIGRDLLVNNMVNRYTGWRDFSSQILTVLRLYILNQDQKPVSIRQISLKYLNRFDLTSSNSFSDTFSFPLPNPPKDKYLKNRAIQTTVEYDSDTNIIIKSLKTVIPVKPDETSFMLELQFLNNNPNSVNIDDVEEWLNTAHQHIEELFIDSLNEEFFLSLK